VLSTLFWMLTLLAYAHYAKRPSPARFVPVFLGLALGLTAKPMLVTLPCVLLLLDYWPLRRWRVGDAQAGTPPPGSPGGPSAPRFAPAPFGRLLLEKVPLFALAVGSSLVTLLAQQRGGAVRTLEQVPFGARALNALVAYATYLGKALYPRRLAV